MKLHRFAILTIAFLCALSEITLAQGRFDIEGRILDQKEQPIPFANVLIQGTNSGAVTDVYGHFRIQLNKKVHECTLLFSCVGFKAKSYHYDDYHAHPVVHLAENTAVLKGVVVKAAATGTTLASSAISSIDSKALTYKKSGGLASALSTVSGVSIASAGANVQLPVIHGLYGNRILIINDGVKHGFQNWGSDHAAEIDVASLNNIQVVKGAAAVRYGPEAIGGVILVNSDPMEFYQDFHGSVHTNFQTNGKGGHVDFNLGRGGEHFAYTLGGSYTKFGDRSAADYLLTNTGKEEKSFHLGLHYHIPNWHFKLRYTFTQQNLGLLRSSVFGNASDLQQAIDAERPLIIKPFSYEINQPNQETAHHIAIADVDWHSPIGKLSLRLAQQLNQRQEFDVRRNASTPIMDLDLMTTNVLLNWAHPEWGDFQGTAGVAYFYQKNKNNPGTNTTPFIPNYSSGRIGAYWIEQLVRGNHTFELGIRFDHEQNNAVGRDVQQRIFEDDFSFSSLSASIGYKTKLSDNTTFRTNLGTAWRSPNMAELYSFGSHEFFNLYGVWRYQFDESGNLNTNKVLTQAEKPVSPERGVKWINNIRWQKGKQMIDASIYVNFIDHYFYHKPVGITKTAKGAIPVYIFEQTDALFAGVDLNWRHPIAKSLDGELAASLLWSKNLSRSEPLINQPPINLNYQLTWHTPLFLKLTQSNFHLKGSYTFEQFNAPRVVSPGDIISGAVEIKPDSEIFDFKAAPEGYFLLDVSYQWQINHFGGQFAVQNALNTSYRNYLNQMRYFADDLGINFTISVNYNF
ncbi:TonB-dependent receptor [Persicobacter psychrovividus]|uniref:Membrane protein n=1 Tax=Persicobacter psychrovividus TaxID=387638 RepID=A0ABN6LCW6_9BACT|nr:membrane protein [Persicobacter psychrovividus]